jgi:YhcH/YjgK/YiaL family protein
VVLDALTQYQRYVSLHPAFPRAFRFLTNADWTALAPETIDSGRHSVRHSLDGDRMYVSIDQMNGRGPDGARLEAHRRYIDIQLTIEGYEQIGWRPLGNCALPDGTFDTANDIGFFGDRPESWLSLPAGHFAIFFPSDAHAPLAGKGRVKKAIVKIAIE